MRLVTRTLGAALAAGALAWLGMTGGAAGGGAATASAHGDGASVKAVAADAPGYAVEDFNYPQADKILAEKHIVLKRGDGHITLADCANGTGQLQFYSLENDEVCFNVTGDSGWLTLELPSVYGVDGNDYTTQVDMTTDDEKKTFDVPANSWTPIGQSADPDGRQFMLVEIRSHK
ncbi:hypothetical protein [Streptomyces montanisoli]|uniref:Secreted protein n=1 Tax=Streptomyces montanisoli TaxID=2798581 RepID=A0A940MKL2_9ACTN|nr:hypothetical protein [Streptomyces montanisoli]MBP0461840.1 hypothetical protein [Streptomyces montanisoli]